MLKTNQQLLLIQDGKLYGRDPIFAVICKAASLPEVTKNHDIQNHECAVHLGQVRIYYITLSFPRLFAITIIVV